jgi:hypothetical protein
VGLAAASVAGAGTLTLTAVTIFHQYQQTSSSPCFIGDSSCSPGDLVTKTLLSASDSSFDVFSPEYSGALLNSLFPTGFIVGIDVNQSNVTQQLSVFEMWLNGTPVDFFNSPTPVPPTVAGGNGTGYADYILSEFSSIGPNDIVRFRAVMPLVNDGLEQFFLIRTGQGDPPPIPEPATMALLGSGLLAIGLYRWRKRAS